MLSASEFSVGSLRDAPIQGLTLLLPRSNYEQPMLITGVEERKVAIFLGQEHRFHAFECRTNDRFEGVLIPDVALGVDLDSLFNPADREGLSPGVLIRQDTVLNIAAFIRGDHGFERLQRITVLAGLASCAEREAAAFRRWQITLGTGQDKRVLHSVDLTVEDRTSP